MEKKKYYSFKHLALIKKYQEECRYEKALQEAELYLKNYPDEPVGLLQCASLLIKLNLLEDAKKILEYIPKTKKFTILDKENYYGAMIRLLCAQEKYQEAYDLFIEKDMENFKNYLTKVGDKIFLYRKLGLPIDEIECGTSYFLHQLYDYSEEKFFAHVKKHFYDSNEDTAKFYKDFPFEKIYPIVKKLLPTEHFVLQSLSGYHAIFCYNNCGFCTEGPANYFKVVFIANTNSIITMYPHMPEEYIGYTDLNYLKNNQEEPTLKQVKRLSQVEKFNQKYNK